MERRCGVEDALDDAPCLLDRILSGEQSRITVEGVSDEALVGVGSVAAERFAVVDGEIDTLGTEAVPGTLACIDMEMTSSGFIRNG